jgi:hypothetical protein
MPRRPRYRYRQLSAFIRAGAVMVVAALGVAVGCGSETASNPFAPDGGAQGEAGMPGISDASAPDPTLGGPCLDDAQCDDGIACTFDRCDNAVGRCRFSPDDASCADDVYCDGVEVCEPGSGCVEGVPVTCSDRQPCTIDACVEAEQSCRHEPRDADGDGDPVWNCGGSDCNDVEPLVSSAASEVCGNQRDDDCDAEIDEAQCTSPRHDTCADALDVAETSRVILSLAAASRDLAASCVTPDERLRDVVVALIVPQGSGPRDIDVTATAASGAVSLAIASSCGNAAGELACGASFSALGGGAVSRLRLRNAEPGAYPLYVIGNSPGEVVLDVRYEAPSLTPGNETCGTALVITPGEQRQLSIIDAKVDLESACQPKTGELLFSFSVAESSDARVVATSLDQRAEVALSLRGAACQAANDELTCRTGVAVSLLAPRLAPGTYYVAVAASAPTNVAFAVELLPASAVPPDETCATAPTLALNTEVDVALTSHADDVQIGCLAGAPDAAYAVELAQDSDVLLVADVAEQDVGAVSLVRPACAPADVLVCESSSGGPLRAAARKVDSGAYRAVVETATATPVRLAAFARPAVPTTAVPFADTCEDAVLVPANGGFFQGNTANAVGDYSAGCDFAGESGGGAPDQLLRLVLDRERRVVLDAAGSGYRTLLDVRRGPACPGEEIIGACTLATSGNQSFLDVTLPAGEYFIQVDGVAGAAGAWFLNAFVVEP